MFNAPTALRETIAKRELILVTGKGGTGKSTVVAALAELAARHRGSALAVELSAHPRLPAMISEGSAVKLANIDLEQAASSAVSRLLGLPALVSVVLRNRLMRLFISTSPAVREMILLDELNHLVCSRQPGEGPVVVDLPASGHALSFLDTPRAVHRMLRVGPLAQIAQRVEKLLLDGRRSELVVVALPEELPINETIELVRRAVQIGLSCRTVIVNQVPSTQFEPLDTPFLDRLEHEADGALGRLAGNARGELGRSDQARQQIDWLRSQVAVEVLELRRYEGLSPKMCASTIREALEA